MNIDIRLLQAYVRHTETIADGEVLGVVADVLTDQLEVQLVELEVQMRRLLADVALTTNN